MTENNCTITNGQLPPNCGSLSNDVYNDGVDASNDPTYTVFYFFIIIVVVMSVFEEGKKEKGGEITKLGTNTNTFSLSLSPSPLSLFLRRMETGPGDRSPDLLPPLVVCM